MDKPERAEGRILDGALLDEFANMHPEVWENHLRPALSTRDREGWALFIGTPEGRNHFYRLFQEAQTKQNWESFTWKSVDVISADEVEQAKSEMDPLIFAQEYEASFISFEGKAYYSFNQNIHASERLKEKFYNRGGDLVVCFDFNTAPGVAAIGQEITYRGANEFIDRSVPVTMWFGEVWIPKGSNSERVARKVLEDWGSHEGRVLLYGDATGGNKGTQASDGSDWDLIRNILRPHFGKRVRKRVGTSNPKERARVNSMNARLRTADGSAHMLIDPHWCPHLVEDLDSVTVIEGTAGELDKDSDDMLTHLTDAVGYYVYQAHPTTRRYSEVQTI
jgi:hypothetical protein